MVTLKVQPKGKETFDVPVEEGVSTFGRVRANTVTLTGDTAISRQHCKFERTEAGVFVADLGSSNGTKVNGRVIGDARVPLKDGDRVQIGATTILVRAPVEDSPPAQDPEGTEYGMKHIRCGCCGGKIDIRRCRTGREVGCAHCRTVYRVPAVRTAD
jgi:pSer/pThr/pTyr-binding forkhead associated (FHA) protein